MGAEPVKTPVILGLKERDRPTTTSTPDVAAVCRQWLLYKERRIEELEKLKFEVLKKVPPK